MAKDQRIEISVVFVPAKEIRRLNKRYRGKDKPTDVLSFPRFPSALVRNYLRPLGRVFPMADPDGVIRLGEVVVAPEIAGKEASLFAHTVSQHYVFLFVHGLLHLLGYDHEKSEKAEKEMLGLQTAVLRNLKCE